MEIITNPIYVLSILCFMVILSVYAGKTRIGKQLGGAALLVILFTAVVANFKFIPSASNSIELYDVIFKYICLLYTSPSPRDVEESRMPSSA